MERLKILLLIAGAGLTTAPGIEHARNPVFTAVVRDGVELGGANVRLPAPLLTDGLDAEAQRAALLKLAGSERALADLLRDSVTAPFILKVHDARRDDGIVRLIDIWFVVRGNLDEIDPRAIAAQASGQSVGAGNMEFKNRLLTAEELKARGRSPLDGRDLSRWFAHVEGRLLDRIEVTATSEAVSSRTADSLVIASRTDPGFNAPGPLANRWKPLGPGADASDLVYRGGISYARIDRLRAPEQALIVEVHAAFIEPQAWFQGAPILRSKFAPIAQDQIRRLRRELRKERPKAAR